MWEMVLSKVKFKKKKSKKNINKTKQNKIHQYKNEVKIIIIYMWTDLFMSICLTFYLEETPVVN